MSSTTLLVCPYCGSTQRPGDRCTACGGHFDGLSRRASHNEMGPWFIRTEDRAFQPGCSYETMVRLIERGQLTKISVVRGPTTRQFWTIARRIPGLAHLLGYCHDCDGRVSPEDHHCPACGVAFGAYLDRDWLGLPGVRPLGGDVPESEESASDSSWGGEQACPVAPGLSSFAGDDELFSSGGVGVSATGTAAMASAGTPSGAFPTAAVPCPESAPEFALESTPEFGRDVMSSPIVRALQLRILRQERTSRVLVVLLVVSMLGGVLVNLDARGRFDQGAEGSQVDGESGVKGVAGSEAPAEQYLGREESATPDGSEAIGRLPGSGEGAGGSDINAPAGIPVEVEEDPELKRGRALLAEAAAARSAVVQLARLNEALQAFESAGRRLSGEARPDDLDARIEQIRHEIELLELQTFFGEGEGA